MCVCVCVMHEEDNKSALGLKAGRHKSLIWLHRCKLRDILGYKTLSCESVSIGMINSINTFAASYLNTQGLNNSCLKSPASTLVDLTFQSRALRSFSLNQLRNLSL